MKTASGKVLLKVVGIILIVFGAIGTILSILALIGGGAAAAYLNIALGAVAIIAGIVSLLGALCNLAAGILGVKFCAVVEKAKLLAIFAIVMAALQVIGFVLSLISGQWFVTAIIALVIGLVLPALFLIGALKNKNAVVVEETAEKTE